MKGIDQGTLLFNRYEVIKGLGEGGSSVVYLAKNVKVGNLVAIKVVKKDQSKVNLMAEKDLLKELRHSAIPIIMDIEEDDSNYYLVEEYVEGVLLGRFKTQLSEDDIVDLMLQLCDVLEYLHTSQEVPIIYRDVKPDNIIRMDNGRIKLIDFGIAIKHKDETTKATDHYGTRGYAAPEQLSRFTSDERTDIFSFGVCIYYLLTGKNLSTPPYRLRAIKDMCIELDDTLAGIITKCIETLPSKRYQNVTQIKYAINDMRATTSAPKVFEVLSQHCSSLMTISGVKSGIGTTHVALMMAKFFAEQDKKVAFIELANREDVIRISAFYKKVEEQRHTFIIDGITYFPYLSGHQYDHIFHDFYDVLIVDAGTVEELMALKGYELSYKQFVIVGAQKWELDHFEAYYYDNDDKLTDYLVNLSSAEQYLEMVKDYNIQRATHLPYNPNPFDLTEEMTGIFQHLFFEQIPIISKEKLGVVNEIKDFIKKYQKQFTKPST